MKDNLHVEWSQLVR